MCSFTVLRPLLSLLSNYNVCSVSMSLQSDLLLCPPSLCSKHMHPHDLTVSHRCIYSMSVCISPVLRQPPHSAEHCFCQCTSVCSSALLRRILLVRQQYTSVGCCGSVSFSSVPSSLTTCILLSNCGTFLLSDAICVLHYCA